MRLVLLALLASLAVPSAAFAEMYEVQMLNRGAAGAIVYEPDFLHLKLGDTVKFRNGSTGHNAATIEGMIPDGYSRFKGKLSEEIEVKLDQEGFYGIKCSPHFGMGMVMVIRVGDAPLPEDFVKADVPEPARKRFDEILVRSGLSQ